MPKPSRTDQTGRRETDAENERKTRIARTAERLFSQLDFDAVSVRDIAAAANVNSALIGYHYGTKDVLYRALFERRYHHITRERLRRLEAVRLKPGSLDSLRGIIRAWTAPLLELASTDDGRDFAALLARQSNASNDALGVWRDYLEPSARRCLKALHEALPGATRDDLLQGYLWMIASVMSCIARTEREARLLAVIRRPAQEPAARALQLETFIAHGFMAMVSPAATGKSSGRRTADPKWDSDCMR